MDNNVVLLQPSLWKVEKIGVIGTDIAGLALAAMLAQAKVKIGSDNPAKVIIVRLNSSSPEYEAVEKNTLQALTEMAEPGLGKLITGALAEGSLIESYDFDILADADVIIVFANTDKKGLEPDYKFLVEVVKKLGSVLKSKPAGKIPLVIFEATLAPTTMSTLIWDLFDKNGLTEGRNILLGNSPGRVMRGNITEMIRKTDKLAGGLHPETPELIAELYNYITTEACVHKTNCLTAEIVNTFENAYRDVKIAFSTEITRFCDHKNIDFYALREQVNEKFTKPRNTISSPIAAANCGMLTPMLGVGGHSLPRDGIFLWWRNIEAGCDVSGSIVIRSRHINDKSPVAVFKQAETHFPIVKGNKIVLLGVAYRPNCGDTKNSPAIVLANYLLKKGYTYIMHDPYVSGDDWNLKKYDQQVFFTDNLEEAVKDADYLFMCSPHDIYVENFDKIFTTGRVSGVMDACNIYQASRFSENGIEYTGVGRGREEPPQKLIDFVYQSFLLLEKGLALELCALIEFYNLNFVFDPFNKVKFSEVKRLVASGTTGCYLTEPEKIKNTPHYNGFQSKLLAHAGKTNIKL